jgi:hypothetical protein
MLWPHLLASPKMSTVPVATEPEIPHTVDSRHLPHAELRSSGNLVRPHLGEAAEHQAMNLGASCASGSVIFQMRQQSASKEAHQESHGVHLLAKVSRAHRTRAPVAVSVRVAPVGVASEEVGEECGDLGLGSGASLELE